MPWFYVPTEYGWLRIWSRQGGSLWTAKMINLKQLEPSLISLSPFANHTLSSLSQKALSCPTKDSYAFRGHLNKARYAAEHTNNLRTPLPMQLRALFHHISTHFQFHCSATMDLAVSRVTHLRCREDDPLEDLPRNPCTNSKNAMKMPRTMSQNLSW